MISDTEDNYSYPVYTEEGTHTIESNIKKRCVYKDIVNQLINYDGEIHKEGDFLVIECSETTTSTYVVDEAYRDTSEYYGRVDMDKTMSYEFYEFKTGHIYTYSIDDKEIPTLYIYTVNDITLQ